MPRKMCRVCLLEKDISLFYKAKTCVDGHRHICKVCDKVRKDKWRQGRQEEHNKKSREWTKKNPQRKASITKAWRERNPEWEKEYHKLWRQQNKDKVNLSTYMRRRRVRQATPFWCDKEGMRDFYKEAKYFGLEVDHIIPLQHPLVCGLHIPANIQLLTKSENSRKGNNFATVG